MYFGQQIYKYYSNFVKLLGFTIKRNINLDSIIVGFKILGPHVLKYLGLYVKKLILCLKIDLNVFRISTNSLNT